MSNRLIQGLAGLACSLLCAAAAAASFPSKPLRVIVAFGPGGVADITARGISEGLTEVLGQPVVIENMPSAGGITGAVAASRAPADGYTLFVMSNQNAVSPTLMKSLPYDPLKQFQMVSLAGAFDMVFVVDAASPLKSLDDVVELARSQPDRFNIGTIGIGSTQHLSAEMFRTAEKLSVPTVPFRNSGDVLNALKGGNVQVAVEMVPAVIGHLRSGSLRALALTAAQRNPALPEVPTVAESGLPALASYRSVSWNGFAVPAGTPAERVDALNAGIRKAMQVPRIAERLGKAGMALTPTAPDQAQRFLGEEIAKWRTVIEEAGVERQ